MRYSPSRQVPCSTARNRYQQYYQQSISRNWSIDRMNPKGASNMGCGASSTAATTRNTLLFVSGQRYGQQQGKSLQTLSKPQRKDAPSARAQKKEQSNSEVLTSTMEQQQRVVSFPLYNTLSTQEDLKIDSFGSALLATGTGLEIESSEPKVKSKLLKKPLLPSKAKAAAEEEDPSIKVHEAVLEYLSSKLSTATEQLFVESATKLVRKYGTQPLFDVLRQQDTQFHHSKSICRVLSVVSKNKNYCNQMVKQGGARILLVVMKRYVDNNEIMILILVTLENLNKQEKKMALFARLEGGLSCILASLQLHLHSVQYLTQALRLLILFTHKNVNNCGMLIKEDGVRVLLAILQRHKEENVLVQYTLQLLAILTAHESNARLIWKTSSDTLTYILGIIKNNVQNYHVVRFALYIVKFLAVEESARNVIKAQLAMLNTLVRLYANQQDIINEICVIIWRIASPSKKSPIPVTGMSFMLPSYDTPVTSASFTLPPISASSATSSVSTRSPVGKNEVMIFDMNDMHLNLEYDDEGEHKKEEIEIPEITSGKATVDRSDIQHLFPELYPNCTLLEATNEVKSGVIKEKGTKNIPHVRYVPATPEPLHSFDSEKLTIKMLMNDLARMSQVNSEPPRVVYDAIDGHRVTAHVNDLKFDANFQSGNCRKVIRVSEYEYDVITNTDVNCTSHTQWFYFSVSNMRANTDYKFNIINMEKPSIEGLQPLLYSEQEAAQHGIGWRRVGENICYYRNQYRRSSPATVGTAPVQYYHTLTFSLQFPHSNDTCYLAPTYPYTATDLKNYLSKLSSDESLKDRLIRSALCTTLAGNTCDLLTITSLSDNSCTSEPPSPSEQQTPKKKKRYVVLCARVHPGEAQSSWMMKGIIDFLLSDCSEAQLLRKELVFKIVPMLNIDGVVEGNHRTSLAGVDLNRQWLQPHPVLHAPIYHLKNIIIHVNQEHDMVLFVDLHGHFRKKNIFMFGCNNDSNPLLQFRECIIPYLLSLRDPNFSFDNCSFKIHQSKRTCGRVVVAKDLGVVNSYTMEASFSGMDIGPHRGQHLDIGMLEAIGRNLCLTLFDYIQMDAFKLKEFQQQFTALAAVETPAASEQPKAKKKTLKKSKTVNK